MLKFRNAAIGVGLLAASTLGAGAAVAAPLHGFVTVSGLNLRAGPGTDYPVVVTMRGGDRVTIYGCLSGWSWCDIDWYGYRGWAAGQYLQVTYQGYRRPIMSYGYRVAVPFLSFSIGPYWDQHYRHRRFFGERPRYEDRHRGDQGPPHMDQPPDQPPHMDKPLKFRRPHTGESLNYVPPDMNQPKDRHLHVNQPPKGPTLQMNQPPKGPKLHMDQPPKDLHPRMDQPPKGQMPHMNKPPKDSLHGIRCKPGQQVVDGVCK